MVTRGQEFKSQWQDEFVSVEHLLQALGEDQRFGQNLLKNAGVDKKALEKAIKDVRGSNRVTDQVCSKCSFTIRTVSLRSCSFRYILWTSEPT